MTDTTRTKIENVKAFVAAGASIREACQKAKMSLSYYYQLKNPSQRKTKRVFKRAKVRVIDLADQAPARAPLVMAFIGTVSDLTNIARTLQ